jgi:CRISPR type III-A-associated protein Csm2
MANKRELGMVTGYNPKNGEGFVSQRGRRDNIVKQSDIDKAGIKTLKVGDIISYVARRRGNKFQAEELKWETDFRFNSGYLSKGYFYKKEREVNGKIVEKSYLHAEILDELAMDVARLLGVEEMKTHQLRRFFNKARAIEAKLKRDGDFEAVKAEILSFKGNVVYQVGRGMVPESFKQFIDHNVQLAIQSKDSFERGFLQHFESVLAFFVYFFRD